MYLVVCSLLARSTIEIEECRWTNNESGWRGESMPIDDMLLDVDHGLFKAADSHSIEKHMREVVDHETPCRTGLEDEAKAYLRL